MSAKNNLQSTIRIGAYNTKPQQPSIVEEVESRPTTTTDVKPKEIYTPKKAFEYEAQPVKKKTASKVKCNPIKVLLALLLILLGIIVLAGLIFLILYLVTLGMQTKDAFCMSDYSCLTNSSLYCLNAKCACYSNTTWNSTKSVCAVNTTTTPNITNTTVITYPINSVVKIFNGTASGVISVAAYAGNAFTTLYDVAYSSITDYYYITDNGAALVVVTDSDFNYVKKANLYDCWYIDIYNTSVYITTNAAQKIYKYDLNLYWQNTYAVSTTVGFYNVFYSTHAKMVYSCDKANNAINAFDTSLNKIVAESFSVTNCYTAATVSSNTVFVGSASNLIFSYVNKGYSTTYTTCTSGPVTDILIDTSTSTNYMLVVCNGDKKINLYTVTSSSATSLSLSITTAGNPYGITIDQYGRLLVAMQNPNRVDVYKLT